MHQGTLKNNNTDLYNVPFTCAGSKRPGRDRIVVSTSRCGRDNPGSNPGHGINHSQAYNYFYSLFFFFFSITDLIFHLIFFIKVSSIAKFLAYDGFTNNNTKKICWPIWGSNP